MFQMKRFVPVFLAIFAVLVIPLLALANVGGRSNPMTLYRGAYRPTGSNPERTCTFQIEIERVQFLLSAVDTKYKIVRIDVGNRVATPIRLSAEKDQFIAVIGDQKITGFLNLQQQDSRYWDSLDESIRRAMAYPRVIDAGGQSPIELSFYVLFPAGQIQDLPHSFTYKIDSLGEEVALNVPSIARH